MKLRFRRTALLALALVAAGLPLVSSPAVAKQRPLGIDVSRFNGTIAWPLVPTGGVRFAFVQASRGSGTDCTVKPDDCGTDPLYATNYAGARGAGLRVGAYHRAFATGATRAAARLDAGAEANVFITSVGPLQSGDLLPVLDVETPFEGLNASRLRTWIRVWLKKVQKRLGAKPIIYTNASSWAATGHTTEFVRTHPLWVAEWGVSKPSVPAANWGGRRWSVWQFTSSGSVPGISGRVDKNYLRVGFRRISVP